MLLQEATRGAHPLSGTIAEWVWLIPLLPFIGFLINGWLSIASAAHVGPKDPSAAGHDAAAARGRPRPRVGLAARTATITTRWRGTSTPGIVSIVGPAVLLLSFGLTVAIFMAMLGVSREAPFVRTLFSWIPAGDLHIDAALQVDPLVDGDDARRDWRRDADSYLQRRVHAGRPGLSALLRVPQPVRRRSCSCSC